MGILEKLFYLLSIASFQAKAYLHCANIVDGQQKDVMQKYLWFVWI